MKAHLDQPLRHRLTTSRYVAEVRRCAIEAQSLRSRLAEMRVEMAMATTGSVVEGLLTEARLVEQRIRWGAWWQAGYIAQHDDMAAFGFEPEDGR